MIRPEFLRLLRCPITGELLHIASAELVQRLNRLIEQRRMMNEVGIMLETPLPAALINESRTFVYPVVGDAPWLIPGEAIALRNLPAEGI